MPWARGLNSVQYNTLNLNGDTDTDLVLFDRTSNKLTTFIWENDAFNYAPQYEDLFPNDLVSWVLLRDFRSDYLNYTFQAHTPRGFYQDHGIRYRILL